MNEDVETATNSFTSVFASAHEAIPKKVFKCSNRDKSWVTSALKRLIRKRDRLFTTATLRQANHEHEVDWKKWCECRNMVTKMERSLKARQRRLPQPTYIYSELEWGGIAFGGAK